jgi:predicted regulator of Ras-like GTPase activity (Roadblock/LC7/MglB family)
MVTQLGTHSGSNELNDVLQTMNLEGNFIISILTDSQGLSIASAAGAGMDPDRQSAVVAFVQKTAAQAIKQLGMAKTEEISLYTEDGHHLVCRPFQIGENELILSVIIPDRLTSYRRITRSAIHQIEKIWTHYWE